MNDPLFGVIPGGQILKIKFKILSSAPAGNTSITLSNPAVIDKNNLKMNITASNGAVTVNYSSAISDCAKYVGVKTLLSTSGSEVNIISLCEADPVSARSERAPLNQAEIDIYKKLSGQINDFGKLDTSRKYSVAYFIHEGTPTTKILGAGERGGVISSYYQAFNKMPQTAADWADVIKIANGRWPSEKNEVRENKIKTEIFKTIYKRNPNMANSKDNAAVTIITYGLRPAQRNTNSEKNAILTFKDIYKKSPQSSQDWDIIRSIAYSGAKR